MGDQFRAAALRGRLADRDGHLLPNCGKSPEYEGDTELLKRDLPELIETLVRHGLLLVS
jgi:hypothetical protein